MIWRCILKYELFLFELMYEAQLISKIKNNGTGMIPFYVSDVEIWAKSNGKTLIEIFTELSAARDFLRSKNVSLNKPKFKTVMRGLYSECKSKN
ncbi:hypothetical protein BpHYR1_041495 [Brachionus plicatilis]|uniref:Uncharacterized protein n=1 Tax=Brachionus plicatilis TaxID=10195 RepID=A0A3M7S7H7_BRAPC|nr:hypothetical protein BpHYR1_041495 [Brachionus plicatilis]